MTPLLARRSILGLMGLGGMGSLAGVTAMRAQAAGTPTPADWPEWAPRPSAVESRLGALRGRAQDIRKFGAKLDGRTDDSDALLRALASGAEALVIPGQMRIARSITIRKAVALFGQGPGPHLVWGGGKQGFVFDLAPDSSDPRAFIRDVAFDGIHATTEPGSASSSHLVRAVNIRGLTVVRCRADRLGLALVYHKLMQGPGYVRKNGSMEIDPAVQAGFSADRLDDLNEDIYIADNAVDYGVFSGSILRFNMACRVVAWRNTGNFAKISWWGGGAKRMEGGDPRFLRRVDRVYIAENVIRGSNGGVYGNNGQNVVVARNRISETTDVGIDFEGCHDCTAYENHVSHAGNFCFATFYLARNVSFLRNYGEQDGSAAGLAAKFGAARFGSSPGKALVGLRSAGFRARRENYINLMIAENELVYSGDGMGNCAPSYFDRVVMRDNRLRNVACDWRYLGTHQLVLENNVLTFDHPAPDGFAALGSSATETTIRGNQVSCSGRAKPGVAIAIKSPPAGIKALIEDNVVSLDGGGSASLDIDSSQAKDASAIEVSGNKISAIRRTPDAKNRVQSQRNVRPGGGAVPMVDLAPTPPRPSK